MKSRGRSSSEKFASAVFGFIIGTHMFKKPRPSTFSLFRESREVSRQVKELETLCAAIEKRK